MPVDVPAQVGLGDVLGHHGQADRLANRPSRQVSLGREDVRVLVGILVDDRWVLADQLGQALLGVGLLAPFFLVFLALLFIFLSLAAVAKFIQAFLEGPVHFFGFNRVRAQLVVNLA